MEIDTAEGERREQGSGLMGRLQQTGDWRQSGQRVLQFHYSSSSCSCQFWELTDWLFPAHSPLHCHLLTNGCELPLSTYVWKGSPEPMLGRRAPDTSTSSPPTAISMFLYHPAGVPVGAVSGCCPRAIWTSLQHYLARNKALSYSCSVPLFYQVSCCLEFCLIGIGFSTDTGVPLQRFHPVVLWDLHKNNHFHFLESQLWSKFLTKMSTAEHLRTIWHKLKLEEMKIAE